MTLYQLDICFELPDGTSTIVYPTLRAAKKQAIEIFNDRRQDELETIAKYDTGYSPGELEGTINLVTVGRINLKRLCDIINSNGGSYSQSETRLLKITMPPYAKRPKIERVKVCKVTLSRD